MTSCEQVTIDGEHYFIPTANQAGKDSCIAYLKDCGHQVSVGPHEPVGGPLITWGRLSDLIEPADR